MEMATHKGNDSQPCRISISKDGFQFEAEGSREFVVEMLLRFAPSGAKDFSIPIVESASGAKSKSHMLASAKISGKTTSVREFMHQMESRKHTDLVLAFGYFLEKFSGQPAFTPADLNNLYYEAKLETSNTSQMIIQNIKRGYLMEAKKTEDGGGKKKYVVTNSGEKYIEGLLETNAG